MSESHSYDGVVRGGPLDGKRVTNNAAKGFVLVDLSRELAWVHDYEDHILFRDEFNARDPEPLDLDKLAKAQEDGGRSVLVYSEEEDNG